VRSCVSNIDVSTYTATGSVWAGGIAGANNSESTIVDCEANGSVTAYGRDGLRVGGIVGQNGAAIERCTSRGSVSASAAYSVYAGGLIGSGYGVAVTGCTSRVSEVTAVSTEGDGAYVYKGGFGGQLNGTLGNGNSNESGIKPDIGQAYLVDKGEWGPIYDMNN
jgi:hypothetical protein